MKLRNLILAVGSSIIPAFVTSYFLSISLPSVIAYTIAIIISSLLLFISYFFVDIFSEELHKYRGQWVEEMRDHKLQRNLIGIGTIRYDHKTGQYTFYGKTYEKNGTTCREIFDWDIKYLVPIRDNALEYICFVENPRESSIGSLKFIDRDAASGNITVMDGGNYTHNAYRITAKMVNEINAASNIHVQITNQKRFRKVDIIKLEDYPKFAMNYSNNRYPMD